MRPCGRKLFSFEPERILGAEREVFAPVIRMIFGEMGRALLLEGQRALPAHLLEMEFPYLFPTLEGALRDELGLSGLNEG